MVGDFFSLSDLFVVGIGFDLAGAFMLAKGLLMSPRQMLGGGLNAAGQGYSPATIYERARDFVDARTGICSLVVGFLLQAAGYLVLLSTDVNETTGARKVIGAIVLALVAMGLVIGLHFWKRDRMVRNTVKRVALAYSGGDWDDDSTVMALQVGRHAGWVSHEKHSFVANDDLLFDMRLPALKDVYGVDIPPRGSY